MEIYKIINLNIITNNKDIYYILRNNKIKIFFSIIILYSILRNYIFYKKTNNGLIVNNNKEYLISLDNYLLLNYPGQDLTRLKYYNISDLHYNYSFKFKLIKIKYKIGFYDINKNLIDPSFITLYNKLHIICEFNVINNNINIYSLPNIYQNKFFECVEFFSINEKIKLGIKLYIINQNIEYNSIYFFKGRYNLKNIKYKNDNLFDPLIVNENYISLLQKINDKKINDTLKFKKSYIRYPYFDLRRNTILDKNVWVFINYFNNYYCFCKGEKCLNYKVTQKCKYYFYLYIIDSNRYTYKKTDYLFMDFIFVELSSDDVYPVFKSMEKQNLPVHYLTENTEIYNQFCYQNLKCLKIIPVNKKNYTINGDFLESYLSIILKLKAVVSGRAKGFNYLTNLFYNLEYIMYIGVGHGVSFFKYFLYDKYETYGIKQNDKLLIPPSDKLISIAKRYGWTDENIIKMNLPRWDKYNNNSHVIFDKNSNITNNSIFIMFTWRDFRMKKKISSYYFHNIINLIENSKLYNLLVKTKTILYFSIHHLLDKYIYKYKKKYENNHYINFIDSNKISECLSKTSLIVSDFSSIIFDIIYRRKPFIIYIPDANDPSINDLYTKNYYELIQSMKNDTIEFENKYFEINETINKIMYYINKNFKLESKLEDFYNSFQLKNMDNINNFINYLKNL